MSINIIKKWKNIGENYLDSNLGYTKDSSQKLSFEQAFQKSINLLPADIQDLTGLSQAVYEISRRISAIKPCNRDQVSETYNKKLMQILATRLVNKYSYTELKEYLDSSQMSDLEISMQVIQDQRLIEFQEDLIKKIKSMMNLSPDERKAIGPKFQEEVKQFKAKLTAELMDKEKVKRSYNQNLLDEMANEICDPNSEMKNNRGIIYAIENQKGCISHLIGTMHMSSNILGGTKIPEIVAKSRDFYSEAGDFALSPEAPLEIVDTDLTKIAFDHHIPIHALDTDQDTLDADRIAAAEISLRTEAETKKKFNLKLKKLEERGMIDIFNEVQSNPQLLDVYAIDAWKKGDSQILKKLRKVDYANAMLNDLDSEIEGAACKIRSINWLVKTNLLSKLRNTEHPISIAVGADHLYGKRGLLKSFKDLGFKLKQI